MQLSNSDGVDASTTPVQKHLQRQKTEKPESSNCIFKDSEHILAIGKKILNVSVFYNLKKRMKWQGF